MTRPQTTRDPGGSPPTPRRWIVTPHDGAAEALSVSGCPPRTEAPMAIDDPEQRHAHARALGIASAEEPAQ
ncbi:hypothetical protein CCR95_01620 [Thiocystis minor]|uniref:hypothetical protein n=1 Tax=Thiocystis minor TaxID=61597 RepID=UPI001912FCF6|nr:hypothetical protein [Thiocystis minor]MBK5962823.1 hypothetical protein [Thiocystis minor]